MSDTSDQTTAQEQESAAAGVNTQNVEAAEPNAAPNEAAPVEDEVAEEQKNAEMQENLFPKDEEATKVQEAKVADDKSAVVDVDWALTRLSHPGVSTKDLMLHYGEESFALKSKEEYWNDPTIRKKFDDTFLYGAKDEFDKFYKDTSKEFSLAKLGQFQEQKGNYELVSNDLSHFTGTAASRFSNFEGSIKLGDFWDSPIFSKREGFGKIRLIDDDGNVEFIDYSADAYQDLQDSEGFGGLVYGDKMMNLDPKAGVAGVYYDVVKDGMVFSDIDQSFIRVRRDQMVSKFDIETGGFDWLNSVMSNNVLEADGVLDYAKILVRAPFNIVNNLMDTAVQFTRVGIVAAYAGYNLFASEELDVEKSDAYKKLTNMGLGLQSNLTSQSDEALQDGFFGSLEAMLTMTADVALQIGVARALGWAGKGAATLANRGLQGVALQQAQQKAATVAVRSVLTGMAAKDSYNDALEHGFTPTESMLIMGATTAALWQATRFSDHILGKYDIKKLRSEIRSTVSDEIKQSAEAGSKVIRDRVQAAGKSTTAKAVDKFADNAGSKKGAMEQFAKRVSVGATRGMNKVFQKAGSAVKKAEISLTKSSKYTHAAMNESIEEMTEELMQDLVKQGANVAVAGYNTFAEIFNLAREKSRGRYMSIFDDGYFTDAAERYLTSGVAGAMGGPMGMVSFKKGAVSNIVDPKTLTDLLINGHGSEVISVLKEMRDSGELGPKAISTEFDSTAGTFVPMLSGDAGKIGKQTSLSDMVFNTYMQDINIITTTLNSGLFGDVTKIIDDSEMRGHIDNNAMRKDFISVSANMVDFHNTTGIPPSVYTQMDSMTEEALEKEMPKILKEYNSEFRERGARIEALKKKIDGAEGSIPSEAKPPKVVVDGKKELDKKVSAAVEEDAENKNDAGDILKTDKATLTELQAQIKLHPEVTAKQLNNMLRDYRTLRAMAKGVSAEHYLMQNKLVDSPVFGSMSNRDPKFRALDSNAFRDSMAEMRRRHFDDETIYLNKKLVALDIEAKILALDPKDLDNLDELKTIYEDSAGKLTEKAVKHIEKVFSDNYYASIKKHLDPSSKDFLFLDEDGKPDLAAMNEALLELSKLEPKNIAKEGDEIAGSMPYFTEDGEPATDLLDGLFNQATEFFEKLVENPATASLPVIKIVDQTNPNPPRTVEDLEERVMHGNYVGAYFLPQGGKLLGNPAILEIPSMRKAFAGITKDMIKAGDLMQNVQETKQDKIYKDYGYTPKGIDVLFNSRDAKKGSLTNIKLVDVGLSDVRDIMSDTVGQDIMARTDSSVLSGVLDQIEFKEELISAFEGLVSPMEREGHVHALADFRRDVIDILEDRYEYDAIQDSSIERHAYKDYTALSDNFVDFLFDPIKVEGLYTKEANQRTPEDLAELGKYQHVRDQLTTTIMSEHDPAVSVTVDEQLFFSALDGVFTTFGKEEIEQVMTMLSDTTKTIGMPASIFTFEGDDAIVHAQGKAMVDEAAARQENVGLNMGGKTKLLVAKWFFNKMKGLVDSNSADGKTPYVTDKNQSMLRHAEMFRDGIAALDINGKLEDLVVANVPDGMYRLYLDTEGKDMSPNEVGALNIKVEKVLFDLAQGNIDAGPDNADVISALRNESNAFSGKKGAYQAADVALLFLGATTTDFTSFYSKLKAEVAAVNPESPESMIMLAEQEKVVKYAAAYMYSDAFREAIDNANVNPIKALSIFGSGGTGKSSLVASRATRIAAAVLEEQGFKGVHVLPVATDPEKIKIITNSVGEMAGNNKGMDPEALEKLLKDAVLDGDAEAIAKLATLSSVLLDEATYVPIIEEDTNGESGTLPGALVRISDLIIKYNESVREEGKNSLSLILMGDPVQSGAVIDTATKFSSAGIGSSNTFNLGYMTYSFRARNSFLTDSHEAIFGDHAVGTVLNKHVVGPGMQYGTKNGRLYGMNMTIPVDVSSASAYLELLNDKELYKSIKSNIKNDPNFNVILAPETLTTLTDNSTLIGDMAKDPKTAKHFIQIAVADVGGQEANYVLGEMPPDNYTNKEVNLAKQEVTLKKFVTLATRPKDFIHIVNRNERISVPTEVLPEEKSEGSVILFKSKVEAQIKQAMQENYAEILKDVPTDAAYTPGETPPITPLPIDEFDRLAEQARRFQVDAEDSKVFFGADELNEVFIGLGEGNAVLFDFFSAAVSLVRSEIPTAAQIDKLQIAKAALVNSDSLSLKQKEYINELAGYYEAAMLYNDLDKQKAVRAVAANIAVQQSSAVIAAGGIQGYSTTSEELLTLPSGPKPPLLLSPVGYGTVETPPVDYGTVEAGNGVLYSEVLAAGLKAIKNKAYKGGPGKLFDAAFSLQRDLFDSAASILPIEREVERIIKKAYAKLGVGETENNSLNSETFIADVAPQSQLARELYSGYLFEAALREVGKGKKYQKFNPEAFDTFFNTFVKRQLSDIKDKKIDLGGVKTDIANLIAFKERQTNSISIHTAAEFRELYNKYGPAILPSYISALQQVRDVAIETEKDALAKARLVEEARLERERVKKDSLEKARIKKDGLAKAKLDKQEKALKAKLKKAKAAGDRLKQSKADKVKDALEKDALEKSRIEQAILEKAILEKASMAKSDGDRLKELAGKLGLFWKNKDEAMDAVVKKRSQLIARVNDDVTDEWIAFFELQELLERLYGITPLTGGTKEATRFYYQRETLSATNLLAYQKNANHLLGRYEAHTIGERIEMEAGRAAVFEELGIDIPSNEALLEIMGRKEGVESDIDGVSILAVGDNIYVIATSSITGERYVASQLNSSREGMHKNTDPQALSLMEAARKAFANNKGVTVVAGQPTIMLELSGSIQRLLRYRVGSITVGSKNDPGLSVAQLRKSGINISTDMYAVTLKNSAVAGAIAGLFTQNENTNLDSKNIVEQLVKDNRLSKNLNIMDTSSTVPSAVGLLAIDFRPKMADLIRLRKKYPRFRLGEARTWLSMAMGDVFSTMLELTGPPAFLRGTSTVLVTTSTGVVERAINTEEDFNAIAATINEGKAVRNGTDKMNLAAAAVAEDFLKDPEIKSTLLHLNESNMNTLLDSTRTRGPGGISKKKGTHAILNINHVISSMEETSSFVAIFDRMFDMSSFPFRVDIGSSKAREASFTALDRALVADIEPLLITTMKSVAPAELALVRSSIEEALALFDPLVEAEVSINEDIAADYQSIYDDIAPRIADSSYKTVDGAYKLNTIARLDRMLEDVVDDEELVYKIERLKEAIDNTIEIAAPSELDLIDIYGPESSDEVDDMLDKVADAIKSNPDLSLSAKRKLLLAMPGVVKMFDIENLAKDLGGSVGKHVSKIYSKIYSTFEEC